MGVDITAKIGTKGNANSANMLEFSLRNPDGLFYTALDCEGLQQSYCTLDFNIADLSVAFSNLMRIAHNTGENLQREMDFISNCIHSLVAEYDCNCIFIGLD